ncbi:Mitotic spindle assembly checkpoint protein MAD1 [Varanus komodoensis]|nr:Mitotic spindle assembly checkpoint protein MAD1 [Varanus komodoensis]
MLVHGVAVSSLSSLVCCASAEPHWPHFCAPQGFHDPSKTKVLHLALNPASLARQEQLEEEARLREECQRLREIVRVLEGGGPLPEDLKGAASLQSPQELAAEKVFDPSLTSQPFEGK